MYICLHLTAITDQISGHSCTPAALTGAHLVEARMQTTMFGDLASRNMKECAFPGRACLREKILIPSRLQGSSCTGVYCRAFSERQVGKDLSEEGDG